MKKIIIGIIFFMFFSINIFAADYTMTGPLEIDFIGVSISENCAYFRVVGGFLGSPVYDIVYIDLNVKAGQAAYSQILAAKLSGIPLNEVYYHIGSGNQAFLERVLIGN